MPRRRVKPPSRGIQGSHFRKDGAPKVRYSSQRDALSAADVQTQETGRAFSVYQCPLCSGWHMAQSQEDR